jgi:WD40 repeat protein
MFTESTELKLWDPATGVERMNLLGHRLGVHSVAFAKRSPVLVSADRNSICIWGKGPWLSASTYEPDTLGGLLKLISEEQIEGDATPSLPAR